MSRLKPSFFQLLIGKDFTACAIRGENAWTLFPSADSPFQESSHDERRSQRTVHLGILLQLRHLAGLRRKEHRNHGDSSLRSESNWSPVDLFLPLFLFATLALLGIGVWQGGKVLTQAINSSLQLAHAFLFFWLAQFLLNLLSTLLVMRKLRGDARPYTLSIFGPRPLHIAWELESFVVQSATLLLLALIASIGSGYTLLNTGHTPSMNQIGLFLGCWVYFLVNASPLVSGPGSKLALSLAGLEKLQLIKDQWLLSWVLHRSKLLPGWSKTGFLAGLLILGWILASAFSFRFFADTLMKMHASDMGLLLVNWIIEIVGFSFCLWILANLVMQLKNHLQIHSASEANVIQPDKNLQEKWQRESALLTHVPELAHAPWKWQFVPRGTLLVRQGESDRTFYSLASGTARVIGLDASGNPRHWITLHGPCGFGEVTFLHHGLRTASILITQDAFITSLQPQDSQLLGNPLAQQRLEEWVKTSQALDYSPLFQRIPSHAKERWLVHAQIARCAQDEIILKEGEQSDWLGLAVDSELQVTRNNKKVTVLHKGDIFGEMAAWVGTPRQASIIATKPGIYLRWERNWWIQEANRLGLAPFLDQLVAGRNQELQSIDASA